MLADVLSQGRCLIPYFTLGDPDLAHTEALVKASFDAGAEAIELGIPFSDPIADGPVIQASHQRALEADPTLNIAKGFQLVKQIRKTHAQPLIFMCAVNLILTVGIESFFKDAQKAQLTGVIIPDLTVEESKRFLKASKKYRIELIFLVSPLSSLERMKKTVQASSGFVYLIASTGTTGARVEMSSSLAPVVKKIKSIRDIPVAVGFGISTPDHVRTVWEFSQAAIIGSHLVKKAETASVAEIAREIQRLKVAR